MLSGHYESSGRIAAPAAEVFEHLDDHKQLSSHMSESSWKMGGAKMSIEVDEQAGKAVGSHIRLSARVLGMFLSVEEVVTERDPPLSKIWETVGVPKLLVVGHYRMGFSVTPKGKDSMLRVFIDYALPERVFARVLGLLIGRFYASWCTRQMVNDAKAHFASSRVRGDIRPLRRPGSRHDVASQP